MKTSHKDIFYYVLVAFILALLFFPLGWFLLMSIKPAKLAFVTPPAFIFTPSLKGYLGTIGKAIYAKYFMNSFIVAFISAVLSMGIALPAAYSFARYKFASRAGLMFWFLSIRMTPPVVVVIPMYLIMRNLRLIDTQIALCIVYLTFNIPFTIWVMKGFVEGIPSELDDAAIVDGCSRLGAFFRIILPVSLPGLVVTFVFCFIFSWNEFLFALILTARNAKTLPVAAVSFWTNVSLMWDKIAAISTICILPPFILAWVIGKYIVRGMTLGAIK